MIYRAITDENFYYLDIKKVARVFNKFDSYEELKKNIIENQILEYSSERNFQIKMKVINRRLKVLNDFLLLKSSISNAINNVDKYASRGNYIQSNQRILSIPLMREWENYMNNYDISSIKSHAMNKMIKSQSIQNSVNHFDNPHSSDFNYQINLLKMKLDEKFIIHHLLCQIFH